MKWHIADGVSFKRGTHIALIAEYDNSPYKFELGAISTASGQKARFKEFGDYIGAKQCTVTIRDFDTSSLEDYLEFSCNYNGEWVIRKEIETEDGQKREFKKYTVKDVTRWAN